MNGPHAPQAHAVVIGASVAGMCAASVLRHHFRRVTLLERDAFPEHASPRPGVPQARHVHVLLKRGWIELERLFPGFQDRMRAEGAHSIDPSLEVALLRPTGWQRPMPSGVVSTVASRDLTEFILRDLLRASDGIEMRDRIDVTGFLTTPGDPTRIAGVRAHSRDGGAPEVIEADLVIDASGRTSKSVEWLRAIGIPPPPETLVDSFASYSSRWFKAPEHDHLPTPDAWWRAIWLDPRPPESSIGGVLLPVEGGRWIVTLFGHAKHYPPTDVEGFERALRDLRSPLIADAVARATPLSPPFGSRGLVNRFRHYERAPKLPGGFIATGDSVCVFNPIHGQGMTVAALCADALDRALRSAPSPARLSPHDFFEEQARTLADPWELATSADFAFPETVGQRPPAGALLKAYGDLLTARTTDDSVVLRRISAVFHMMQPNKALSAPDLVARVLYLSAKKAIENRGREAPIPPVPPRS